MSETTPENTPSNSAESPAPEGATFDAYDSTWTVTRKVPGLLFSEMARTDEADPAAAGLTADFFEAILGPVQYRKFYRAALRSDDESALPQAIADAMVAVSRFPTTP